LSLDVPNYMTLFKLTGINFSKIMIFVIGCFNFFYLFLDLKKKLIIKTQ
jgi:hypothetical protein